MAKPTKPETAKAPKVDYIRIEKRNPTPAELDILLEASLKVGVRPGYVGVMATHESNGTWHPEIRPNHPDKPPVRVTTTGDVVGTPGSSGVGIGQWLETRWFLDMYKHGEDLLKAAELDRHNPAAIRTIRAINTSVAAKLGSRKADWNNIDVIEGQLDSTAEGRALHRLRSDPTNRIPIYMLAFNVKDYSTELASFGLPVTGQNIYGTHHTSAAEVATLVRRKDYVPGAEAKWAVAAERNGGVFMNPDGSLKTGTETYNKYGQIMNDALAAQFERQFYGRDFGPAADAGKPRTLKAADGQSYKVRNDLILPRLPAEQFLAVWRQPVQSAATPENLTATVGALERLGYDFGKARPESFENSRFKAAVSAFKHQAGLPFADKGEFDVTTQRYLQQAVQNADRHIALQQQQAALLKQPGALNLRTVQKELSGLPQDAPLPTQVREVVIGIKKQLAAEGLIKQPTKLVAFTDANGKKRRREEKAEFDGSIDNRLISALSAYQGRHGLADTKGVLERVTLQSLHNGKAPVPAATPAPAAQPAPAPQAPNPNPRISSGKVSQAEPANKAVPSPTQQFTAISPSLSGLAVRKVSLTAGGSHVAPHVASYGPGLRKGNQQFDERVYEVQRLLTRVGHGKLLGGAGADGLYGDNTEKALVTYAASRNISKKPGEVSGELLEAMRQDRMQLASAGRSPDFFERYLSRYYGAPAPEAAPPALPDRLHAYSTAYPNVISSQLHDPSSRWGKTQFGITSSEEDYKLTARLLVERGHLAADDLAARNAPQRVVAALKEYQADIGLIPTGRLDRATFASVEQTLYPNAVVTASPRQPFNNLGNGVGQPQIATSALAASLTADLQNEDQRPRSPGGSPRLNANHFTQS